MDLRDRLQQDSRDALRAREAGRLRLSVLRMVLSAVRNAEIDGRRPLSDEETEAVVGRELRQRQDSLAELAGRGRPETEAQLRAESEVLRPYLPAPLPAAELEELARAAIAEAGAPAQLGRVMALLLPRVLGRADGAAASAAVRRLLGG